MNLKDLKYSTQVAWTTLMVLYWCFCIKTLFTYIALYTAQKMKGTLNCHIKSLKLEGYQSVQLQSISDCESVSLALVLMKVTTGTLERQDNPPKSKEF